MIPKIANLPYFIKKLEINNAFWCYQITAYTDKDLMYDFAWL